MKVIDCEVYCDDSLLNEQRIPINPNPAGIAGPNQETVCNREKREDGIRETYSRISLSTSEPKEMKSKSAKQLRVNDNCGVEYKMPSYEVYFLRGAQSTGQGHKAAHNKLIFSFISFQYHFQAFNNWNLTIYYFHFCCFQSEPFCPVDFRKLFKFSGFWRPFH